MSSRYVTLSEGRKVSLQKYIAGVKYAKAHPEQTFPSGLTCWYSCTGAAILKQFKEGMHRRITEGVPYSRRGM